MYFFNVFFLLKNKITLASISLLLCVLTKHNAIAISFILGIYCLVFTSNLRRFGIFSLLLSIVYYIIGVELIMSHLQENPVAHFKHFAQFGNTPIEALVNVIYNPQKIFSLISREESIHFIKFFFPAGLLSLFSPIFWISSPQIMMNASLSNYHSIFCGWHWALIVPFIFIGIVSSIDYILSKFQHDVHKLKIITIFILLLLLMDFFFHFSLFNSLMLEDQKQFYFKQNNINPHEIINQLSIIEPNTSVMVSGQLLWFFFNRKYIYTSRVKFHDDVDYIAILLPIGMRHYRNIDYYIIKNIQKGIISNKLQFKNYNIIIQNKNLIILKHTSRQKK